MAFLTAGAPNTAEDEIGPFQETEYAWGLNGFVWSQKKRTIYTYRVYYYIDDTHGEAPNATWTVGADTYQIRTAGPELQFLDKRGIYVVTYEKIGSWAWV